MENTAQVNRNENSENVTVISSSTATVVGNTTANTSTQNNAAEMLDAMKPFVKKFTAAMSKVEGKDVSQIAGVIWDEFKAMSPFQKMLVILGTALVVGAGVAFSWKLVGGNWETIKAMSADVLPKLKDKVEEMVENMDTSAVLKKMTALFEKRQLNGSMAEMDVRNLLQQVTSSGYGAILTALIAAAALTSQSQK